MRWIIPHPFFGYVLHNQKNINNFGFHTPDDFPYQLKNEELVVGVFGASVAQQLAHYLMETTNELMVNVCNAQKKIKFINFAIQTQRQPQAFQIFHAYGDQLDLAINLDGNNEIRHFPVDGNPREYPFAYEYLYQVTQEKQKELEHIYFLQKWQFKLIHLSKKFSFFDKSELYFKINFSIVRFLQTFVKAAEKRIIRMSIGPIKPENKYRNDQDSLRIWKKYTILQSAVARKFSVPLISFIQPTQYLPDSKIFSEEERKVAILDDVATLSKLATKWNLLGESIGEIKKSGANIVDLRKVFAGVSEPIFVDTCCHVNRRGNEILSKIVLEKIREQLKNVNCSRFK